MPQAQEDVLALSAQLDALGIMMVSELSGLVAGVVLCPEPVKPSAWFSLVTERRDGTGEITTIDRQTLESLGGMVVEHYNSVSDDLSKGLYQPLFAGEAGSDDLIWDVWIEGFMKAVKLAPNAWDVYFDSADKEASDALDTLFKLVSIFVGEPLKNKALAVELKSGAAELIGSCVLTVYQARLDNFPLMVRAKPVTVGPKVGRNDPCPCGSGKKFKTCCG